jgi:sugar (pentulose or hexulose) kinase
VEYARERAGAEAAERAGCRLATGYMGATLFWLQETQGLPERATACFVTEFLAAWLTGRPPLTEPTMAASSGLLDLRTRDWNVELLARLGLPRTLFPAVGEAGDPAGELSATAAESCGLPAGLPIFVGLGDMQAAFLGSVAEPATTVAVNVGTGAQVMRYAEQVFSAPSLETRPFPRQGYLLTHAGLAGGAAYATLERFFAAVAREVLHVEPTEALYAQMNALAQSAPPGCAGLRCEPVFAGSREDPELRGSWTGISEQNFTPATFVRALLEGLARGLGEGYASTVRALGTPARRLVGAGNGLRENRLLAALVAEELGLPLQVPAHREEAAYGAALVAGFGAGLWPDLGTAARVIQYEQE